MRKKNKGFTMVELLGVLVILSVIIGLAFATFTSVRDKTLQSDYENVVSYLETKAGNYAKDTGITTVSVGKLIEEGYAEPDDETDIYDPRNNKSLNCYIIISEYEEGDYNSKMEEEPLETDGKCDPYTETVQHEICRMNANKTTCVDLIDNAGAKDNTTCKVVAQKTWCNGNLTLGVKKTAEAEDLIEGTPKRYEWTSSTGNRSSESTIETNVSLVSQSIYKVRVYYEDNKKVGEATKNINIDKEAPKIVDVKTDKNWKSLEKNISVTLSDGNGSGIEGIYVGTESTCPTSGYEEVKEGKYEFKVELQTVDSEEKRYICTIDKVGNISSEAYEIIVSNKDKEAADMYDLTGSPTEWTKNNVTLTGSAQDYKSGLVAYKFVKSTTTPNISATDNDWKTDIGVDKNAVVSKTNVVTENNVSNERWYYCVKDEVGNVGCSKGYQVTNIDREIDGEITIVKHEPKEGYKNVNGYAKMMSLTGRAQDTKSGIVEYLYTTSSSTTAPTSGWKKVTRTTNLIEFPKEDIAYNGTYYLWVKDYAGNTARSKTGYTINNIDTNAPTGNVTWEATTGSKYGNYALAATIKGTIADNKAGIAGYYFTNNSSEIMTENDSKWNNTPSYPKSLNVTGPTNITAHGAQYYLWVKDALGNIAKFGPTTVYIDREGPYFTGGNLNNNQTWINVNSNYRDDKVGVNRVYYYFSPNYTSTVYTWQLTGSGYSNLNGYTVSYPGAQNTYYYVWSMAVDYLGNYSGISFLGSVYTCGPQHYEGIVNPGTGTTCSSNGFRWNGWKDTCSPYSNYYNVYEDNNYYGDERNYCVYENQLPVGCSGPNGDWGYGLETIRGGMNYGYRFVVLEYNSPRCAYRPPAMNCGEQCVGVDKVIYGPDGRGGCQEFSRIPDDPSCGGGGGGGYNPNPDPGTVNPGGSNPGGNPGGGGVVEMPRSDYCTNSPNCGDMGMNPASGCILGGPQCPGSLYQCTCCRSGLYWDNAGYCRS